LINEILDGLESQRASRRVEVRSGHDGTKKEEAGEDMEGYFPQYRASWTWALIFPALRCFDGSLRP